MKEIKTDYLIIGGGLSGIMSAYCLEDSDYVLLEKSKTLGGYCRTIRRNNFVWDYAGHFFHFRTQKYHDFFHSLVDPDEIIYNEKNTKIFYKNKLINYPFQTHIHELGKQEMIDCLYDLCTKKTTTKYNNYLEMLYSKFGRAITQKFLQPYNEKLYATDLNSLDKKAMGRFFPYADLNQIITNMKPSQNKQKTYNDNFMYLREGTEYFIEQLAKKIPNSKIHHQCTVLKINEKKHYVTTDTNSRIYYKHLISSIPLHRLLGLLSTNKEAAELASGLSYNKVLVFNIGFDAPSPNYTKEHWVYFGDKNINFYRVGFYNNILKQKPLSIYVEIGFAANNPIDVQKEFQKTLEGLKRVGIIDDGMEVVDYAPIVMDPAYVHITCKDGNKIKKVLAELEKTNIYCIGRYGTWTYNSMEDCMEMADSLIRRIKT